MHLFQNLGHALRFLRMRRGLTQRQAAALLGVRQSQISRWETSGAASFMRVESLDRILNAYEATFEDLGSALTHQDREQAFENLMSSALSRLKELTRPEIPQPQTGIRFRELRAKSGWTLDEVAERTGLSQEMLEKLEAGEPVEINSADLRVLAEACCGTIEDLLPRKKGEEEELVPLWRGGAVNPHG
jgi:transcriptional regulator with XRE-family HTH domain